MKVDYTLTKGDREVAIHDHVRVKDHGYDVCYVDSEEWPCLVAKLYRELVKKETTMTKL